MLDDAEHQVVTAARSKQGWDALPVHDQAVGAFDKATDSIVNGMANERQKTIVRRMASQQRGSISTQLDNYTNSEVRRAQSVDADTAAASTANLAVSHYQDQGRLAQDFAKGEAVVRSYGQRAGLTPETVDAQVATWRSNVHVGVVERALQDQNVAFARTYLETNRDAIEGGQLGRLEKAVAESGTLADAFAATDRIMASATSLGDAQKMVREIKDPEVRQRAQTEVDQRFNEQEASHRIAENHLYEGWSTQLERNGDGNINHLRAQMGADWLKLDTSSRESLEARARQIEQQSMGVPIKTDERVWTDFTLAPPEVQAQVNPLKDLLPYLSEPDYQAAVQHIAQLREGGKGAVAGVTDAKDQLLTAAQGAGIVPRDLTKNWSDLEIHRYAGMQRAMNEQIKAFHDKTGKNPDPTETQKMVDGLLLNQVRVQKPILGWDVLGTKTVPVPASSVIDADVADMTEAELAKVNVPPEAVAQYTNRYRSIHGDAISRVDVVRLWLAALRHDRTVWEQMGLDGP
jgi:hypothetical protein